MEPPRTPMDNLLKPFLSSLSVGHEKALKQGIYNAVALFLLCLVCAAGYGLFIILNPFLKPLIWALLCGSALFPFKLYLTNVVQSWFDAMENSHQPLLVNLSMIPLKIVDQVSETIGAIIERYFKIIVMVLAGSGGIFMVYSYTPSFLTCLMWRLVGLYSIFVRVFIASCNIYMVQKF